MIDIPVIVIGGGGCGLVASMLLSNLSVEHILFEKHPGTSFLPKAHYLNQRTMETFRHLGISDDITRTSTPPQHMCRVEFRSSLAGTGLTDGRLLGYNTVWGNELGGPDYDTWRRDSPAVSTNLPLIRLEPILYRIAEERNPGRILFNHRVMDLKEEDSGVLVAVAYPDGKSVVYRAQYVIAADGGKLSTAKLGINMEGPSKMVDMVTTHFKADLSEYWDDGTIFAHFINPEGEKMANLDSGSLVQMGPTWGRKSEEWVLHFGFPVNDNARFNKAALLPRIRQLLKLPNLDLEVIHISHWLLDCVLADKYRKGRVFLAGDAAHRFPPTTGLGLNTAIEDAQNLVWKIAAVVHGKSSPALLDTYEIERRPVGRRNADWALLGWRNFTVVQAAIGLIPGQAEHNRRRFKEIFEDSPFGHSQLSHIQRVIETQDLEFRSHDMELGFTYKVGACIPDGTEPPPLDPTRRTYIPTSRPGHRLPHAWVESGGEIISTHDLLILSKHDFFIITDESGVAWVEAAAEISRTSKWRIEAARIQLRRSRLDSGDDYSRNSISSDIYYDYENQWSQVGEVGKGGAILVRPDNFIAWRGEASETAHDDLRKALVTLSHPISSDQEPVLNG